MKQFLTILFLLVTSLTYSIENSWHTYWLNGLKCLENEQYIEAKEMFSIAVINMSEIERQHNPDVLMHVASTNYVLEHFDDTLKQTEELISSEYFSDQERLICGSLIVSALWKKGMEDEAIEAYFNYIASSPIVPKCQFEENKIMIKNVPQCKHYKKSVKSFFIQKFCNQEEDFQEYGNVWVINLTKKCECGNNKAKITQINKGTRRTPEVIRGCCNTCSTLAVGAFVACGRLPGVLCQTACTLFIEMMRQACEGCCYNGGIEEKCWENFSFWKDDFRRQKPQCDLQ